MQESYSDEGSVDPYETDEDPNYEPEEESERSDDPKLKDKKSRKAKKTKKRVRIEMEWQDKKRKRLRDSGKEYVGFKKKVYPARSIKPYIHSCRYHCNNNIPEEDRIRLFNDFYNLSSYDLQNSFLSSCIKKKPVCRKKATAKSKSFSSEIFLLHKRVCKMFLLKTFDISNKRFTTVCAKTSGSGICGKDKRGYNPGPKIDSERKNKVKEHINSFPKYVSHYSRNSNLNSRYLASDLTLTKMYTLYTEWCKEQQEAPVKYSYYRFIFNTKFNLRFHRPNSDTCSKCDSFENIIKHSQDPEKVQGAKIQQQIHQRKAEKAVHCKKNDVEKHSNSAEIQVICFDLQQTLPTPLLTTSKVFYLRQLWTYNFCVHNLTTGKSDMYVWDETISSRGSQDIGSCLIHYITKVLPETVTKLIAYSDSCGGQNKNKNIVKMFMFCVKATRLQEVHHKFLEPGHTFMECDRDFGLIEKVKRKIPQVFIPEHWIKVIQSSCKKFTVHAMTQKDFYSFQTLNDAISDPKKDTTKSILKWRQIQYFKFEKSAETYSFFFKTTLEEEFPFNKCVCPYKISGRPNFKLEEIFKHNLNQEKLKINKLKWDNLISLLDYIPPLYHNFYRNLPHDVQKNKKAIEKTIGNVGQGNDVTLEPSGSSTPSASSILVQEQEPDDDVIESDYEN